MAVVRLKHVESWKDRHGHVRHYFRRGKGKRIALPGDPCSPEFMEAYHRACQIAKEKPKLGYDPRSFHALIAQYFQSPNFLRLKKTSAGPTRSVMEAFAAEHGKRQVEQMTREHVEMIVGKKAATPAAANTLLKRIRTLINYSIALGWRTTDPTRGIPKFREGEFHTWTDAELAQFEAHWPIGTIERTAFSLAVNTGQRRADLSRMTWADIEDGMIRVVQGKTGTDLIIPMHPDLKAILAIWPRRGDAILSSARRKPYTVESFGNLMASAIGEAGLPVRCVLHGLRKAAARRLAEVGCTASQIAAITGHKSLSEIERYTRKAEQRRLAVAAIDKLSAQGFGDSENKQEESWGRSETVGRSNG